MTTFSIITATFNSRIALEKTMQSVLSQGGVDLEYLLVDGGSTDGTVNLIKEAAGKDSRIRWVSEPDQGISDAFNKGLAMASGEIIGILNADDTYVDGTLEKVANCYAKQPSCDVFHGEMLRLDASGHPLFRLRPDPDIEAAVWLRMPIYHPTTFVTRRAYNQVGGFDVGLKTAMDYDLILRLFKAGRSFCLIPELLARMPYGGVSEQRMLLRLKECYMIRTRHGYATAKALFLFVWGLFKGTVKFLLVHSGLSRLLTLLPKISRE